MECAEEHCAYDNPENGDRHVHNEIEFYYATLDGDSLLAMVWRDSVTYQYWETEGWNHYLNAPARPHWTTFHFDRALKQNCGFGRARAAIKRAVLGLPAVKEHNRRR